MCNFSLYLRKSSHACPHVCIHTRVPESLFRNHHPRGRMSVFRPYIQHGSPTPVVQRTLIKSSRSCRRGKGEGRHPFELLRQSLSQIKVRFGARENNSAYGRARARARASARERTAERIPRARPGFDSEYLFDEPDLSSPPSPVGLSSPSSLAHPSSLPPPLSLAIYVSSLEYRVLHGNARDTYLE